MTECSYTGDIKILQNDGGDWDIDFLNGQPFMTDGFDTSIFLSLFTSPDTWQNGLTTQPDEQFISEFPEIIGRNTINDNTLKNGIQAIKRSLDWMITDGAAQEITVTGGAVSVYALYWQIDIIQGNISTRYTVNWNKGIIEILKNQEAA